MKEQHPGVKPSDKEYLSLRKTMTSKWYNKQEEATHSMYTKLAETWNTEAPPPEVQRK